MQHLVETVAENFYLDRKTALLVAQTSDLTSVIGKRHYVSSRDHDAFVAEVRSAQGSEADNQRIRLREMDRRLGITV